jgi:hypothetical protein
VNPPENEWVNNIGEKTCGFAFKLKRKLGAKP